MDDSTVATPDRDDQQIVLLELESGPQRRLDAAGRLGVITARASGDSTEVDVFDGDGAFLGTVTLRDRVRSLAIRGQLLAALVDRVAPEVEGVPGLDLYTLER